MRIMMVILAAALLVILMCSAGCGMPKDYNPTYDIPPIGAASVGDIGLWMLLNIRYQADSIHDRIEYWQSPDQTYTWRTGDCEDYALLMMYFIATELGGDEPMLVTGTVNGAGHAWVRWNGEEYEAQGGYPIGSGYEARRYIPYHEALWRSETAHRSVVERRGNGRNG